MPSRRPWFRLYTAFRTDPRVQSLGAEYRAAFVNLLCLAGESTQPGYIEESDGKPYGARALAKAINVHPAALDRIINTLIEHDVGGLTRLEGGGLLMSKWGSNQPVDPSAQERMLRYRAKLPRRNTLVTVTPESRVEYSRVEYSTPLPPSPDAETAVSSPAPRKSRKQVTPSVGLDFETRMRAKFSNLSPSLIHDQTMLALAHTSATKYANTELYVQNWLRREAERVQVNSNRSNGQARYGPPVLLSPAHHKPSDYSAAAARAAGAPVPDDMP